MKRPRFHTRQTTFRQLETFLAVAERLSVTEAARALHLAQPSVSTQIAKLEQALRREQARLLQRVFAEVGEEAVQGWLRVNLALAAGRS